MALEKVVIAGGTGFVGTRLAKHFLSRGTKNVTVLTRTASKASAVPAGATGVVWAPEKVKATGADGLGWEESLANADLVVNLAGAPVVSRWTEEGKKEIVQSRLNATRALAQAIRKLDESERPKCFASASAVGYYGTSEEAQFDEGSKAGDDFLAQLCVQWEDAAKQVADLTRVVIVRIGIVLGSEGGALANMLPAFKVGLGGGVGSGRQWVSWVHEDDLCGIFEWVGEGGGKDVVNATAPGAVRMQQLAEALGKALNRPCWLPVPELALKLLYGGGSMVVLEGQRVLAKELGGFEFSYKDVDSAMKAVVKEL